MEKQSLVVEKLSGYLQQNPESFEITILPTTSNDESNSEQVLSLNESIVLMEGKYLGLDARSLPWMTREIRQKYKQCKANSNSSVVELLRVTACLLLVNPDHATVWADRRRCLLRLEGEEHRKNSIRNNYIPSKPKTKYPIRQYCSIIISY